MSNKCLFCHSDKKFFGLVKTIQIDCVHLNMITGIRIYRIANGKIVKHWANMDLFGMMAQRGAMPVPGM
jgi:predicted ester cyclase